MNVDSLTEAQADALLAALRELLIQPNTSVSMECAREPEEVPDVNPMYCRFRPGPVTFTTIKIVTRHGLVPFSSHPN